MHVLPLPTQLLVLSLISLGVYIDAKVIGVRKGQVACLLPLIIGLPAYLLERGECQQVNARLRAQARRPGDQDPAAPGSVWPPPPGPPVWAEHPTETLSGGNHDAATGRR